MTRARPIPPGGRFRRRLAIVAATLAMVGPAFVAATVTPNVAFAQAPEVSLRPDAAEVEVGMPVTVTLSAMTDASQAQPSDPTLKVPQGVRATGPFVSTQTRVSIVNGRISQQSGMRAEWRIVPSTPGTLEIGPASVTINGKRVTTASVRIVVRPPGTLPRRGGIRGRNPLDPFGQLFPFGSPFGDDDTSPQLPESAPVDPQLSLDAPLDPQAFLRAVVDKQRAVVGEQVTVSIYLYTQVRAFQVLDPHEPPAIDFYQRPIQGGEGDARAVAIGGSRWMVQMIRKVALFPLKSGDLTIGPMTVTLVGPGLRGGGVRGGIVRASRPQTVQVLEPPSDGRPPGYAVGDVGRYTLTATVEPRSIPAGGSIAVRALLRGTGNVPAHLHVPEQKGVTWLDPDMREQIDAPNGVVQGSRTFTYVVKLDRPGVVQLGELTLPVYDPQAKKYDVLRVPLGAVNVTGQAPPTNAAEAPRDPFAAIEGARAKTTAWAPPKPPITDAPWFWLATLGAPVAVVVLEGATRGVRRVRAARAEVKTSTATRVREAIVEARGAEAAHDGKKAASAVERAVVVAVEGATGLKLRGLLREEVKPALEKEGLSAEDADETAEVLRACDAWRFEPGAAPPSDPIGRAEKLAKKLARWKKPA